MIILIGGIKGGCGKTTLAVNLAVYLASINKSVLLVDSDDQQTATDFTALRSHLHPDLCQYTQVRLHDEAVLTQVKKLSPKFDYVIIDTGGRDTASQRAALGCVDKAIIPFVPRAFDIWTINKIVKLAEEIRPFNPGLELHACINKADISGTQNQETIDTIKENGNFQLIPEMLINRKSYAHAASSGLAVFEYVPQDKKASEEFINFAKQVVNIK